MEVLEDLGIKNLKIYQDTELYRFTSDAVLLSKFASCKKGEIVADFCSGSGIVGLHYFALNENIKSVDLIEIQNELAKLSQKTITLNNLDSTFKVLNMPLQQLDNTYNEKYSLILCNPPYKKAGSGEPNPNKHLAICRHEVTITQEEIVKIASKKLKYQGRLCMCQRTERLTDLIICMRQYNLEPSRIQFVVTNSNKKPYLFLIEGVKNVKPQLKVLENVVNGE